jgi:hypothetical protein
MKLEYIFNLPPAFSNKSYILSLDVVCVPNCTALDDLEVLEPLKMYTSAQIYNSQSMTCHTRVYVICFPCEYTNTQYTSIIVLCILHTYIHTYIYIPVLGKEDPLFVGDAHLDVGLERGDIGLDTGELTTEWRSPSPAHMAPK